MHAVIGGMKIKVYEILGAYGYYFDKSRFQGSVVQSFISLWKLKVKDLLSSSTHKIKCANAFC